MFGYIKEQIRFIENSDWNFIDNYKGGDATMAFPNPLTSLIKECIPLE